MCTLKKRKKNAVSELFVNYLVFRMFTVIIILG